MPQIAVQQGWARRVVGKALFDQLDKFIDVDHLNAFLFQQLQLPADTLFSKKVVPFFGPLIGLNNVTDVVIDIEPVLFFDPPTDEVCAS